MSDPEQPRSLPVTLEELEAIIDARIEADRQRRSADGCASWMGYDPGKLMDTLFVEMLGRDRKTGEPRLPVHLRTPSVNQVPSGTGC